MEHINHTEKNYNNVQEEDNTAILIKNRIYLLTYLLHGAESFLRS